MLSSATNEAIVFFDGNNIIIKEMLYSEFEAVLDHVVSIPDFSEQHCRAAYLCIDDDLDIIAAVFFLITFDGNGFADKAWNIPLQTLVEQARFLNDMKISKTRILSASRCADASYRDSLWEPVIEEGDKNLLRTLRKRIKKNSLGLITGDLYENSDKLVEPSNHVNHDTMQRKLSRIEESYRLRIAEIKQQSKDYIEGIQNQMLNKEEKLRSAYETSTHLFSEEKSSNMQLKKNLQATADELNRVKDQFQRQWDKNKEQQQAHLLLLEEQVEKIFNARLKATTDEFQAMIAMRDNEIHYREQQIRRLNTEISQMRFERKTLVESANQKSLQRLIDSGINAFNYPVGEESLSIPAQDITNFMADSQAYIAERLSVTVQQYRCWLSHYQRPVCGYTDNNGKVCGKPIPKTQKPSAFIAGESDRCSSHSRSSSALSSVIKVRDSL